MKKIAIIILVFCCTSFSLVKLKDFKVLGGKLSVLLPETFRLMSLEEVKSKYPNGNPPTEVYTSNDYSVNIAFNHTANPLKEDQVTNSFSQIVKQFENLYPSAKWLNKKIIKVNGRDFILLEMIVGSTGRIYYNLIGFTSVNNRLLISSFNCPASQQLQWQSTAQDILKSIK